MPFNRDARYSVGREGRTRKKRPWVSSGASRAREKEEMRRKSEGEEFQGRIEKGIKSIRCL